MIGYFQLCLYSTNIRFRFKKRQDGPSLMRNMRNGTTILPDVTLRHKKRDKNFLITSKFYCTVTDFAKFLDDQRQDYDLMLHSRQLIEQV